MKTQLIVLAALATTVASFEAAAAPAASCTLQSTSRLDAILNPPKGSDERFFTAGSGPPNIMMLLDTSCSMSWWPIAWSNNSSVTFNDDSSGTYPGCRQANIDALGYDKLVVYPRMWINLTTESPWFIKDSYYQFNGNGGGSQVSFNMGNNPMNFTVPPTGTTINTNADVACNALTGNNAGALGPCKTCLANKGYFQWKDDRRLAIGNFLNFYGPRGQSALNAISNAIRNSTKARFGVIAFSAGSGAAGTVQWPGNDVNLFAPMGPTCANSLIPAQIAANSGSIISKLATGIQFNTGTPLDQYLYGAMHYFRGTADPFPGFFPLGYPTAAGFTDVASPGAAAICFDCGFSAMILLTDGQPNQSGFELPKEIRNLPTPCPSCGAAGAGINNDSQGGNSHIFRTADWAWNHDLRPELAGIQRIATYTVAFALNDADTLALLNATAVAGGGNFYLATNSSQLSTSLSAIINDVTNRNISFSSSSISSFQTGSTNSAILPRMAPGKNNLPWLGSLWRFNQFNEFVENFDKNGDGDLDDIFVVDSTGYVVGTDYSGIPIPGDIVIEDSNGAFVKKATPAIPAVPFYEARAKLLTLPNDTTRNILTVLDTSGDGRLNSSDTLSAFSVANAATIAPYLGILGTSFCPSLVGSATCVGGSQNGQSCTGVADCPGGLCPAAASSDGDMLKKFGLTAAQTATLLGLPITTQAEMDTLCVRTLIEFVRGRDVGDEDADNNRTELRPSVLGDIFHSSPVVVDPPVDRFVCDLVVNYQCVTTLYNQQLNNVPATPLASRSVARCGAAAAPTDAYDEYLHVNRRRDKVILVGANDGMLHAFRESVATETQAGGLCTVKYQPSNGQEMWAFIPPDQLSRLRELVLGHTYFVDGDVMVRDIWADGSGSIVAAPDGKKQADEFHTVAVVAEGRGGVHYFALDIRGTPTAAGTSGGGGILNPKFLWMFPQPDSEEAALAGKSLLSITPKAPPIGPVLLKNTGALGISGRYGRTEERWVAMLSGGWSPGGEKGRGIYMVDVWNGVASVNGSPTGRTDNLLWKMEYAETVGGGNNRLKPTEEMRYGIAAPVAMADFGANDASPGEYNGDGFFDTAVVGDLAGQVWVARMHEPGEIAPGNNLITNWSGARAFQMDRDGVAAGSPASIRNRQPFYYLPALVIQPDNGALRAMLGSGDRNALLDNNAGQCRFDNPLACAKYGCDVKVEYEIDRLNFKVNQALLEWDNTRDKDDKLSTGGGANSACGTPGSVEVKAKIKKNEVKTCPRQGGGSDNFPDIRKIDVECGQSTGGNFSCRRTDSNTDNLVDLNWPIETARLTSGYLGNNRFFAMRVYGGLGGQVFDETATNATGQTPKAFDDLRITDRTSANPGRGDLVDVTNTTCDATGFCTCATPPCSSAKNGNGWMIDYVAGLEHKTGGGGSLPTGGCLLWNVVYPTTTLTACSTSSAKSRFFQAQYLTGEPNCAEGLKNTGANTWVRYQERSVLAPPPEPSTAIAINKVTGQLKYSGVVLEPGSSQATEVVVSKGNDVLQSISSVPLTRQEHLCRHVDRKYCDAVQP